MRFCNLSLHIECYLVHLILSFHVASKVVGQQEPVIALGHVIHVVHQVLEVLSMAKGTISDSACQDSL